MKLHTPSWKSAWYEEGLSERFAQEMSRLEKTVIKDIETSAQWVEQLVIELGMLAQNMIHLEGESRRDSQIRLAFEKALKVSALSAHLMGALDQAVDRGPALLRYSNEVPEKRPASTSLAPDEPFAPAAAAAPGAPTVAPPSAPAAAVSHAPPPSAGGSTARHPAGMRSNMVARIGIKRQAAPREVPSAAPRPTTANPMVNSLMDISQPLVAPSGNPMREMILSLSRRGLSRSEIEVITEQPRHVIEAVLTAG
jgi:hypothetical protein